MNKPLIALFIAVLFIPFVSAQYTIDSAENYTITPSKYIVFYGEDFYFNLTGANNSLVYIDVYNNSHERFRRYQTYLDENGTNEYKVRDIENYKSGNYSVRLYSFNYTESQNEVWENSTYFKFVYSEVQYLKIRVDELEDRLNENVGDTYDNALLIEHILDYIYKIGMIVLFICVVRSIYDIYQTVFLWPMIRAHLIKIKILRMETNVACSEDQPYVEVEGDIVDFHLTDEKIREIVRSKENRRMKRLVVVDSELVEEIDRLDKKYRKEMHSYIEFIRSHPLVTGRKKVGNWLKEKRDGKEVEKELEKNIEESLDGENDG